MVSRSGCLTLVLVASALHVQGAWSFREVKGVVSMEAEHATTGAWTLIKGTSGSAFEDPGRGDLTYTITFTSVGKFYVHMLAGTNICGGDKANDCWITLDGEKLYGSDNVTRPDGIRVGNQCCVATAMCWTQLPRGPGSHTPTNIKYSPVYAIVKTPGQKVFKVIHYAQGFRLDKIVLTYNTSAKMTGLGPAETVQSSTALLRPSAMHAAPAVISRRIIPGTAAYQLGGRVIEPGKATPMVLPVRAVVSGHSQQDR